MIGDLLCVVLCPLLAVYALVKLLTTPSGAPWWLPLIGLVVVLLWAAREQARHEVPKPFRRPQ